MSLDKINRFNISQDSFLTTFGYQDTLEKLMKSENAIYIEEENTFLIFDNLNNEIEIKFEETKINLRNKDYNIKYNILEEEILIKYINTTTDEFRVKINNLPTILKKLLITFNSYKEAKKINESLINKVIDKKDFLKEQIEFFKKNFNNEESIKYLELIQILTKIKEEYLIKYLFQKHTFDNNSSQTILNMNLKNFNFSTTMDFMTNKNNIKKIKEPKINGLKLSIENKTISNFYSISKEEVFLNLITDEKKSLDKIFDLATEMVLFRKDYLKIEPNKDFKKITQEKIDTLSLLQDKNYNLITELLMNKRNNIVNKIT